MNLTLPHGVMGPFDPLVIDAGHGGYDSGAVNSDTGLLEKTVCLYVANRVFRWLDRNTIIPVYMTRRDDRFLRLSKRAQLANKRKANLISIHCNASGTEADGFECFTSPGQTASDTWATLALEEYDKEFPNNRERLDFRDGDPDKERRFTVLTRTTESAILFELEFIDSVRGEKFLSDRENLNRAAEALGRATARFYGYEIIEEPEESEGSDESDGSGDADD